jgi:hypothetical protein
MRSTALRSALALGLAAIVFSGCAEVMSALNIFLVRFFYAGGGVGSWILPTEIRDAATVYSSPLSASGLEAANRLVSKGISTTPSGLVAAFTDKSKYGMNLAFGLGADNSGNSDEASFPLSTGLSLFVQERASANEVTTQLAPFSVAGGARDTIPVEIPVTLAAVPNTSFKAMLKGDSIPYWLTGKMGFALKSPTGDVLSSQETEMDIATQKIATRPSDNSMQTFMNAVANAVK